MRIVVYSNLFEPDHAGGAAIYSDLCFELAARGHHVVVRCAYPYFPEWKDKSGRNGVRVERVVVKGVIVERHGLYIPSTPSKLKSRALYEGSFIASLARSFFRRERADVVMAFSTMLAPVAAAVAFGKAHHLPILINVQDLSSGGASAANLVGPGASKVLTTVETKLLASATSLSSISPEMVEGIGEMTGHKVPVHFVPNWLNASMAASIDELESKIGRNPESVVRILYAGNIGNKQGLLEFCQRAVLLDQPFELTIHGSGPGADAIAAWHTENGDPRIKLGPFLPEHDFIDALQDTDLFLITERQGSGNAYMPSKLIPAISSGTPILAVCDADSSLGGEMRRADIGPYLTWDHIDDLPALLATATDNGVFTRWQKNAVARSAVYERTQTIDLIEDELESIVAARAYRH
ncbi:MAG: colanic acid biosynthesis glycosyltransferase WcaI [Ilumatobacteraceae bacterium]|nr:colanic acid biosynthesis glycosyltransferase WcaI [Ilumatobacteraceae bacterium]